MNSDMLKQIVLEYKEDVLYPFDSIIEIIGFDALCAISETYSGSQMYVPTKKNLFARCIEKQVIKEFNGKNYIALAKKYGLCESTVRKYVYASKAGSRYE